MSTDTKPSTQKMKPQVKARWLEALRSDRYKQGKQRLRWAGRYCCLGVLCDVEEPDGWAGRGHERGNIEDARSIEYVDNGALQLSTEAAKFWRIYGQDGWLSSMNDKGESFDEIADWIEANL